MGRLCLYLLVYQFRDYILNVQFLSEQTPKRMIKYPNIYEFIDKL
jgi:hypothetical protein